MARIYPLFSSSKGNSVFIGSASSGILIDAGVTYRRLLEGLHTCGLEISAVKGIFITHEHSDHIKGLSMLTKSCGIPVFGQGKTLRSLIDANAIAANTQIHELTGEVAVGDMRITAFDTPHDTVQSCGFRIITADNHICAVCTDLGHISRSVEEGLAGCELVLLEANYDDAMLLKGPYPPYVKTRIRSDNGHLSNSACAAHSKKLIESGTTRIILGHISQENNTPSLAENAVAAALSEYRRDKDYILKVAPVATSGEMLVL